MKVPVLELKPTQFSVGMREVTRKIKELKAMSRDERHEFLHERPVPVVISPYKFWRLVDHHHHARACWEAGIEELPIEVKADFSHLSIPEFWAAMDKAHWVHPYDQFGKGPHEPLLLPEDVRGLADDQFRSLAWALRHSGDYEKSDAPFSEFAWADYLRAQVKVIPNDDGFEAALKSARVLAHDPKAKGLPGYKPK